MSKILECDHGTHTRGALGFNTGAGLVGYLSVVLPKYMHRNTFDSNVIMVYFAMLTPSTLCLSA